MQISKRSSNLTFIKEQIMQHTQVAPSSENYVIFSALHSRRCQKPIAAF